MQGTPYSGGFKHCCAGLSVKWSPFKPNLLACSTSENFGIVGKGNMFILEVNPQSQQLIQRNIFPHNDAVFDCSWTEFNENLIISASGEGKVILWDIQKGVVANELLGHTGEVNSVECSHKIPNLLLSAGNDRSVKLWDLEKGVVVQNFANAHSQSVYKIGWHPHNENLFSSVGQDCALKIWDLKSPQKQIAGLRAHEHEILSSDFNKYVNQIATSSADNTIKIWDLKMLQEPIKVLNGHRYPVKTVKFCPFTPTIMASASYDMNIHIWDIANPQAPLTFKHQNHTEFAISIDFNQFNQKQIATTSWDGRVLVWNYDLPQPQIP